MSVRLNENEEIVKTVKEGLARTGGYCPCRLARTEDNKCICREFREQIRDPDFEGYCHCMLYYKSKDSAPAAADAVSAPASAPVSTPAVKTDITSGVSVRRAEEGDVGQILRVVEEAKGFLARSGVDQWQDGFPAEADIRADLACRVSFVYLYGGQIVGFDCLATEPEAAYAVPLSGAFRLPGAYGTIHRTAVSDRARGHGVGHLLFRVCEEECRRRGLPNIRVDTHRDNKVMRHLAESLGYIYAATVRIANGTERVVYEKALSPAPAASEKTN